MKQYYSAADMERFMQALTRYLEIYKAQGDPEADRNFEIKPSNDLMGLAQTLDDVKESIDKGFGGLEGKPDRPLGRGPPAATPRGPPENRRPPKHTAAGRRSGGVILMVEDGEGNTSRSF